MVNQTEMTSYLLMSQRPNYECHPEPMWMRGRGLSDVGQHFYDPNFKPAN